MTERELLDDMREFGHAGIGPSLIYEREYIPSAPEVCVCVCVVCVCVCSARSLSVWDPEPSKERSGSVIGADRQRFWSLFVCF